MHTLVSTGKELDDVIASVLDVDRYAIDTEFHRERTYFPQVALIQLAWKDGLVLIDPLEVNLKPLAELLEGPGTCIVHAGVQDLEVLDLSCGTIPKKIFDTQIAAGFLGVSTGSLASLLDRFLSVSLPKGDRLTDWLRRPLTDDQLRYAASDVEYLLELTDVLEHELGEEGRTQWAVEECELLKDRPRNRRVPEEAILRIKEARSLKGQAFRVAT
ncbi:MAG: ribonuclease D, partial [Actinomycetota bacterium]